MRAKVLTIAAVLTIAVWQSAIAQDIQVSRTNKTVEVSVTSTVEVEPEIAVISIGYENYGRTRDAVFKDNVRQANQITKALIDAGIPSDTIETDHVQLERNEPDLKLPADVRAEQHFHASQTWHVQVPVSRAQIVVDLAVKAGSNDVQDVDWTVKDMDALEDRASGAALAKARALAEKMVTSMGTKLGELLYASNTSRRPKYWPFGATLNTEMAMVSAAGPKELKLRLFPKKVRREATVHAIFAIQ